MRPLCVESSDLGIGALVSTTTTRACVPVLKPPTAPMPINDAWKPGFIRHAYFTQNVSGRRNKYFGVCLYVVKLYSGMQRMGHGFLFVIEESVHTTVLGGKRPDRENIDFCSCCDVRLFVLGAIEL